MRCKLQARTGAGEGGGGRGGYLMPRSPAMPQHGTDVGFTSLAQRRARFINAASIPIFLLLHGTCTATVSFTCTARSA